MLARGDGDFGVSDFHFVVYGRWKPKVPTNGYLMPTALAKIGSPVLFVQQTLWNEHKTLTLQPWKWDRLDLQQESDTLWRLTLHPPLPRKTASLQHWFCGYARRQLSAAMLSVGTKADRWLQMLFGPAETYALDWLPDVPYAYRVIDDYSAMPYFAHDPVGARRLDEKLAREAVAVFPSNPKLYEAKRPLNAKTRLIPNAVNFDHFSQRPATAPADLIALPRPIIGFAGALDRYKVDFALLEAVARARPDWSFALLGEVGTDDATEAGDLPQLPNLHYMGFRAYDELPAYLHSLDVGLIPYVRNSYTEGVFPLKLYEYLASGLSVVSTDLPFVEASSDVVFVGHSTAEFVAQIERALSEGGVADRARRVEIARSNSWEQRARDVVAYLEETLG